MVRPSIHNPIHPSSTRANNGSYAHQGLKGQDSAHMSKRGNATDRTVRTEPTCVSWILPTIRTYMAGDSLSLWWDSTWNDDKTAHAHTLLQQWVPMLSRFQTPIGDKIFFFARPIILLFLPLVITFLPPLSLSLLHDVKRTNERANEQTNER
jgi:hypothetical protein